MSLVTDLGAYLASQGIGTLGATLFVGFMPATPDACVAVNEYSGAPPVRAFAPSLGMNALERPRVQISARATSYVAAQAKALQVQAVLDWLQNYTSSDGVRYYLVEALQRPPFPLLQDENDRTVFAANYSVLRSAST